MNFDKIVTLRLPQLFLLERQLSVTVHDTLQIYEILDCYFFRENGIVPFSYDVFYEGELIPRSVNLLEMYGIRDYAELSVIIRTPKRQCVLQSKTDVLEEDEESKDDSSDDSTREAIEVRRKLDDLRAWSDSDHGVSFATFCEDRHHNEVEEAVKPISFLQSTLDSIPGDKETKEWTVDLVESLILLMQDLYVSYHSTYVKVNMSCALMRFIKSRTKHSLTSSIVEQANFLFEKIDFTKEQSFKDGLDSFGFLLNHFNDIKESKAATALKEIVNFGVAFSFFENLGVPMKYSGYSVLERELMKKKLQKKGKTDFIFVLLKNLHFLAERGYQFMITGRATSLYHSSEEYSLLFDKISLIRLRSKLLTNPEAHGFTEPEFRADLDDVIEKLEVVIKFNTCVNKIERNKLKEVLNELHLMRFELNTLRASREHRDAPFSVLLHGESGVGKSTLKDILFYHFAQTFDLPSDRSFCYTRNPVAKYWDGFVSSCWCVMLDDIAFKNPNLGEDQSCMEFLQIVNSVPFVPDQAALEQKGRTPLKAKLVIGTTNVKHLNSHQYFSCPSAAQRRFPYIITPMVKPEYETEDHQLDASKVPKVLPEGEYPDYWLFKVQKVQCRYGNATLGGLATFDLVDDFSNIYDLLAWYSEVAISFKEEQATVKDSIESLRAVVLCKDCFMPQTRCICGKTQSCVEKIPLLPTCMRVCISYILYNLFFAFAFRCFIYLWDFMCIWYLGGFASAVLNLLAPLVPRMAEIVMRRKFADLGRRYQKTFGRYNELVRISGAFGAMIVAWCASRKVIDWLFVSGTEVACQSTVDIIGDENRSPPTPKSFERENVWYNSNIELSEFNLTPMITSSKSLTREQLIKKLSRSIHCMKIDDTRVRKRSVFRILNLKGNKFVMNNHSWAKFEAHQEIELISSVGYGVTPNIKLRISETCVKRYPDEDLAVLTLRQVNPGPDVTGLFTDSDITRQNGFYLRRMPDGSVEEHDVYNTQSIMFKGDDFRVRAYSVHVHTPTQAGFCGMPLIAQTPMGYVILGIHVGGEGEIAATTTLTQRRVLDMLDATDFQEGNPELSAESQSMSLGSLHEKSVFNYVEEGVVKVYGSFLGFRQKPKTMVGNTPIHDALVPFGYEKKYTAPLMSGYVPFRIAALDMVDPIFNYDSDILREISDSFYIDIFEALDGKELYDLHPYDLHTAINGCPGVAYVDRMKVSTSAGNPWKCKKLRFLQPLDDGTDNFILTSEIKGRVNKILESYARGIRYHPVFCAHLKDEPVTFKKASIGKTRVFTGAPMDWSIVVRMYYLPLIRLIQNNKYDFETGVGTVAQSIEWTNLMKYLLREDDKFQLQSSPLLNKFIAGDYKSFDKRMPPAFMMEAFKILIRLTHYHDRYTDEDRKIMYGIAYDTCYPTVDFNGDLVQFFGSNPSGHPLTVIINSLVNSLYIRYAYYVLHPKKNVRDFQKDVRLMTYGDDNIMTSNVDWFNHTAISNSLADIGIVYTMADKEASSVPFISLTEVTFLKRSWRWEEELFAYMAPLDHDSIEKMLMTWTRSKISEENQMMDIIKSAMGEYFFYGKKVYYEKMFMFKTILEDVGWDYLIDSDTFPSWEDMTERFERCSVRAGFPLEAELDLETFSCGLQSCTKKYGLQFLWTSESIRLALSLMYVLQAIACFFIYRSVNHEINYFYYHERYAIPSESLVLTSGSVHGYMEAVKFDSMLVQQHRNLCLFFCYTFAFLSILLFWSVFWCSFPLYGFLSVLFYVFVVPNMLQGWIVIYALHKFSCWRR